MRFIDEATIEVRSGDGGAGSVHFMRQKYMPKMGPDGGDGGAGGSVYFEASTDLQSLLDFKFTAKYAAEDGEAGMGQDCNGRNGKDLVIRVPPGTVLRDAETGQFMADLLEPGVKVLLLRGGRGGLGNMNFATASRQAPDFAQTGEKGHSRGLRLELKLLADVGLVGFPNAGKSTLISRMSSARPKIADYPFTTLVPNLGVVRGRELDFVIADVPGIIEGASEGRGLGLRFLKHLERTRILVIMLDLDPNTGRSLPDEYDVLRRELQEFSNELGDKTFIVALNKTDAFGSDIQDPVFQEFLAERGYGSLLGQIKNQNKHDGQSARAAVGPLLISAVAGQGLDALKEQIETHLKACGPREIQNEIAPDLSLGDATLLE